MPNKPISADKVFKRLIKLAVQLRSPTGCPWDRKQTIFSLAPKIEEEGDELLEAVKKKDYPNLCEEMGDLLFNLLMVAQIAEEEKRFTLVDILQGIEKKIKSRHSWVFGKDKAKTPEEAIELWKKNKEKERKFKM